MQINPEIKKIKIGLLLNSLQCELWMYNIIKSLVELDHILIELIVINDARTQVKKKSEDKTNRFKQIKSELKDNYLFFNYLKWDKEFFAEKNNAFETRDVSDLMEKVEKIKVSPRQTKFSDFIEGDDLIKVQEKQLDVIIRFGFRILKGEILNAAQYGVWSYHHDDNTEYRGAPGLFWEVYENNPKSGTILQILNTKLDNGKVIYRSLSNTKNLSFHQNRNNNYLKTSNFILIRLKQLHLFGWDFIKNLETYNEEISYEKKIYKSPNNKEIIKLHFKLFFRNLKLNFRKQFFNEYWEVYVKIKNKRIKIKSKNNHWYADPFPIKKDDSTYVFFEDFIVDENKACISCVKIDANLNFSEPKTVLKEDYHLSYPHVFLYEGEYYMIPETKESNSIRLYKSSEFPFKWEYVKTLISDVKAVDATILFHHEKVWLFTNIEKYGVSSWEELHIYYSDNLFGEWKQHALNPVISDVSCSRPAGNIYKNGMGKLFRPSQDCSISYGYAININEIVKLNHFEYKEKIVRKILPNKYFKARGIHTYNTIDDFMFFDLKKSSKNRDYNIFKFLKNSKGIYHHRPIRLFTKHLLKLLIFGKAK